MEYTYENLTLNMSRLDEDDFMGLCRFEIPWRHKEFLTDGCGVEKNPSWTAGSYEHLFEHQYGEIYLEEAIQAYVSTSADLLIAYMSWILSEGKPETINVEYEHFYWGIHDVQHALNDESGCTIYVDGHVEKERLIDGFKIMNELGHYPTYKMIEDIQEGFEGRFKMSINLEEFLEPVPDWD